MNNVHQLYRVKKVCTRDQFSFLFHWIIVEVVRLKMFMLEKFALEISETKNDFFSNGNLSLSTSEST